MATRKRLVLFVEGEGDVMAVPVLVKRLLTELAAWDCLSLDPDPFRMGAVNNLFGKSEANWIKNLQFAAKGGNLGAVLLLQDGDITLKRGQPFCAGHELLNAVRSGKHIVTPTEPTLAS